MQTLPRPFPTLTSRPFTIIPWRTRKRCKVAGRMFKTCFHGNHACNPVLSKRFRWDKAYYLQCLNIPRLWWQIWVKDYYACSKGCRSEEATMRSRAVWMLLRWTGALGLLASLSTCVWPCPQTFQNVDKCPQISSRSRQNQHLAWAEHPDGWIGVNS